MTITIETVRGIDGPNIWSPEPVTHLLIDLGPPEERQPENVRAIADRLFDLLPLLVAPASQVAPLQPLPFPSDPRLAEALGTLALNLQRKVGIPVHVNASRLTAADRVVEVVVQHDDAKVGAAASRLAVRLLNEVNSGGEPDLTAMQAAMARFGMVAASRRYGTAAETIVATAKRRGIPVSRVDPSGRIVELGNGAYRRRIHNSLTSFTSVIADSIVSDKALTNHYLRTAGLPVPPGSVARTVERAVAAAQVVGYPVVVKPVDLGGSYGVTVDLRDDEALRAAFTLAASKSPSGRVLVEQYIAGSEYRALVVDDQVIVVSHRVPAHVMGDGRHTIQRLIEIANADPRRGPYDTDPLRTIVVDAATLDGLERHGLGLESIPSTGYRVPLKPTAQVQTGAISIDRTDDVHPDNAAILRQAARTVGADVACIDLVAPDIAESMWATGGAILEVNTRSGFRFYLHPAEGQPRDPGPAIVDMLFPPGRPVRAPIVAVADDPPTAGAVVRLLAAVLTAAGGAVGVASRAGLAVDGRPVRNGDALDPSGVRTVLNHPSTEVVVAEVDPREFGDRGLGFASCDVAVVTALSGLATPSGRPVETVLTSIVEPGGVLVLDAGDPGAASLAQAGGIPLILFSLDPENGLVRAHVARGGTAVVVRSAPAGDQIALLAGETVTDVARADARPALDGVAQTFPPLALLAAVAAAVARDVPLETIRRALS